MVEVLSQRKELAVTFLLLLFLCHPSEAYTNQEICDSIWIIEGGEQADYPWGIVSVKCTNDCEQICLNTVRNNRVRYREYGFAQHENFLNFLASRYCPICREGCDPRCIFWLDNLKFYLKKGRDREQFKRTTQYSVETSQST